MRWGSVEEGKAVGWAGRGLGGLVPRARPHWREQWGFIWEEPSLPELCCKGWGLDDQGFLVQGLGIHWLGDGPLAGFRDTCYPPASHGSQTYPWPVTGLPG